MSRYPVRGYRTAEARSAGLGSQQTPANIPAPPRPYNPSLRPPRGPYPVPTPDNDNRPKPARNFPGLRRAGRVGRNVVRMHPAARVAGRLLDYGSIIIRNDEYVPQASARRNNPIIHAPGWTVDCTSDCGDGPIIYSAGGCATLWVDCQFGGGTVYRSSNFGRHGENSFSTITFDDYRTISPIDDTWAHHNRRYLRGTATSKPKSDYSLNWENPRAMPNPAVDPFLRPGIGVAAPEPLPRAVVPYRRNNPNMPEQSSHGYSVPIGRTATPGNPTGIPGMGPVGHGQTVPVTTPLPQPPEPGVKEKKIKTGLVGLARLAMNAVTETGDAIDALYKALPKWLRDELFRRNGYQPLSSNQRLRALYRHIEALDVAQAVKNLVLNEIEDQLIGRASRRVPEFNQLMYQLTGRMHGIETGPAL